MRILVDRFIYQGLHHVTSRHAARDQPVRQTVPTGMKKGSLS
jgi:hypothetical protein